MVDDQLGDIDISSEGEFEAALSAVVEAAVLGDVEVRGAWELQTRGSNYDWEVEVVELARGPDDGE